MIGCKSAPMTSAPIGNKNVHTIRTTNPLITSGIVCFQFLVNKGMQRFAGDCGKHQSLFKWYFEKRVDCRNSKRSEKLALHGVRYCFEPVVGVEFLIDMVQMVAQGL